MKYYGQNKSAKNTFWETVLAYGVILVVFVIMGVLAFVASHCDFTRKGYECSDEIYRSKMMHSSKY